MQRLPVHGLDPAGGTDGQVPVISGGKFVIGDAAGAADGGSGASDPLGATLTKRGIVLALGSTGSFDAAKLEGPSIMRDPRSGRYAMVYVGYDTALTARAGYAYSDDLRTWTKAGVLLGPTGVAGDPDQGGVTGPVLYWDRTGDQYVLYYIGLTGTGYEAGTKTICYATATSLAGPWTRHGAVISTAPGWRSSAVYHVSIVERAGSWYCFFNASNGSVETIGYATAPSLTGPWTVDDANSPVLGVVASTWESTNVGDPAVRRVGDMWVMDYYGFDGSSAADGIAVTSDADFPLGWQRHPGNPILVPSESYDGKFAHKPFTLVDGGTVYHYYTAVAADDTRQIALAVSTDPAATTQSGVTVVDESTTVATAATKVTFTGAGVTAAAGNGGVVVTVPGATSSSGAGELLMQDGVTAPPVPLENEARNDWLYQG